MRSRLGPKRLRRAGDNNNGGGVVNTVVANVGGLVSNVVMMLVVVRACLRREGRAQPDGPLDEARGWSAQGRTLAACVDAWGGYLTRAEQNGLLC